MGDARVHTKGYGEDARVRLGLAVTRAREAAGHRFRPSFAKAAGIGVRSLFKLETGAPVGPVVYEAASRALPGWTEDTPQAILEGSDPPPLTAAGPEVDAETVPGGHGPSPGDPPAGSDDWLRKYHTNPRLVRLGLDLRAAQEQRELLVRAIAEEIALAAERELPHGVGDHKV